MYLELWSARNDSSVKILVYEGLVADAPNGYGNHLPIIADFLGISGKDRDQIETRALYEKVARLVSREKMIRHVDKFDDHFIAEAGKKYGRALRIMEPAAKVRPKGGRTELSEATIEWLEDQWFERMTPLTGHATYDEFATHLSESLFAEEEAKFVDDEVETAAMAIAGPEERNETINGRRGSSIVMRRKSSLVIQEMPGLRKRRESLAPHE